MTHASSANIFTGLTGGVIAFQLALVGGAPWGALTQGGRVSGVLSPGARADHTARFRRAIWGVVAYCALGIVANAATPSPAERALWLPVVTVMFLASLHVARRPDALPPTAVAPTGA